MTALTQPGDTDGPAEPVVGRNDRAEEGFKAQQRHHAAMEANKLLLALHGWDVMVVSDQQGGDGKFWRPEIDRVRAELNEAWSDL